MRLSLVRHALILLVLVAATAFTAVGCGKTRAEAGVAGWERLGTRTVRFAADRDTIMVTGAEGTFRRLQFAVDGNNLQMWDVKVHYANGEVENIGTRLHFREGTNSRVVDLSGWKRIIRRITFRYSSYGRLVNGRSVITVYGKQ